ncbi:hypothetical protein [Brunnivagina elsteri]|uniref:Uncharacterized protein n=1 Tax=Brunnivagina elsteri CCALA 953 TaxID=987040 RepID=A0A2A2TIP0_9CYAN|nr:hypothetical protein [Calothrix elsteri]PAX53805.1 hypothetical protein CK510_13370 [Calothrix elsteri CCALA 953]
MVEKPIKKSDRPSNPEGESENLDAMPEKSNRDKPSLMPEASRAPRGNKREGKGRKSFDSEESKVPSNPALARPAKPKPPVAAKIEPEVEAEPVSEETEEKTEVTETSDESENSTVEA